MGTVFPKDYIKHDETLALNITLAKFKVVLIKIECMHDVFMTVHVEDSDELFTDFMSISEYQEALSNKWYYCWANGVTYQQNLHLSFELSDKNMTKTLLNNCLESHDIYFAF